MANTAPIGRDDTFNLIAGATLSVDVANELLVNDSDPDGDPIGFVGATQPTNGTLIDNGDGTLSYTPNDGYVGTDSFTYTITDGTDTATATVTLQVDAPNTAPTPSDDSLSTARDTALIISASGDLLANDTDADADPLSVVGVGTPTNGTLIDNGDGTYTYTPNAGYTGADSFTYTVSDGTDTATATVTLDVTGPTIVSDDFSASTLDPMWSLEGPGGSLALGQGAGEAWLEIAVPSGNYDAWNTNTAVRAMQDAPNGDFQVEARYLSTPSAKYQIQGILIEQDATTWLRFDLYSTGSRLFLFGATTRDGSTTKQFQVPVAAGDAEYLRITRGGDLWTFEYSADGQAWSAAGSYTFALDVTSMGPYAGATGGAPGYTARVDYFFDTAAPISPEDPTIEGPPVAVDDALITAADTALTISVANDLLANDSDPNGDALTLASFTQPTNGTLVDNGDGTLTYTPNAGYEGPDGFTYAISDGTAEASASVGLTVGLPTIVSDDFSGASLDAMWALEGSGGSLSLGQGSGEAWLEIAVPNGNYDAWNANTAVRAMQNAPDGDFQVEARFLSTPVAKYQIQGVLIEQDTNNWLRFDTYSDGKSLFVFGAATIAGSSQMKFKTPITAGDADYLRVTRSGDVWSFEYSPDGETWTQAGTYAHALNVTSIGPYAGATGGAPGYTARVDYFFDAAAPVVPEDADQPAAPVATDDNLATPADTALTITVAEDLLANDMDANGDVLTLLSFTQPTNGALVDNGDGTLTYTPAAGYSGADGFTYTIGDGTGLSDTATVSLNVQGATNATPQPRGDSLGTLADTALTITVATDLLGNDSDPDGDPLTLVSFTQPTNGTLVDNGDGTLTYTPAAGYEGPDGFTYTISDGSKTASASVSLTVGLPTIISDDFRSDALDPIWALEGPGGSLALAQNSEDAWLEIVVPTGGYDAWNSNTAVRAMQDAPDGDFQVQARYLSTPSVQYQMQGVLIEQDANNWIRFDTYSDGGSLRVFGAVTVDGASQQKFNVQVAAGTADYLRATRSGDVWTFEYSADGQSWSTAGSYTHALNVTQVGPFAGATGGAPGYTAQVDYFFDTAAPISPEDAGLPGPPVAGDDALQATSDGALTISVANDLLANDSDPAGDPLTLVSFTQPRHGTLVDNGDGTLTYTPEAGYSGTDGFTYTVDDGNGLTDTARVALTVAPADDLRLVSGRVGFDKLVVDTTMDQTHAVASADLDGDGDIDLVATDYVNGGVSWYRNDGGSYTKFTVDGALAGAYPVVTADLDQDGAVDILATGYLADATVWYRNDGAGTFTKTVIDGAIDGPHFPLAVDLDGDGDLDLVTANQDASSVVWYENQNLSFTKRTIDAFAGHAKTVDVGDVDGDGDLDVLAANYKDSAIALYLNDGSQGFTKQVIDATATGAYFVVTEDLDGDGDLDVASASALSDTVAWYRNDGGGGFTKIVLTNLADGARTVHAADVDGDGDMDLLSASADDSTVRLFTNDGAGNFTESTVDSSGLGAYGVSAVDANGDGLVDVLTAARDSDEIAVQLQTRLHDAGLQAGQSVVIDASRLQATDPDTPAGQLVYTVTSAPAAGTLRLAGVTLALGDSFTQADVDTGALTYVHDGSTTASDGFAFSLTDGEVGRVPLTGQFDFAIDVQGSTNTAPQPQGDSLTTAADTALTITIATDLLGNDSDPDGDPLTLVSFTQPTNGTLVDNADGTLTYTPTAGYEGPDGFTYTVSDGSAEASASVGLTVGLPTIVSDDFSGASLDAMWALEGPGGSLALAQQSGEAWLEIVVPTGTFDPWNTNGAVRAMQDAPDGDFQVQARYLSTPSVQYQMQGILIEQDAGNWIRFDTYSDGSSLRVFSAVTVNGTSQQQFNVQVAAGAAEHLRVTRSGDVWTFEHSADGQAWSTAGSYTHALNVTQVGPFAGATGGAPGYTAQVDYFFDTAAPISPEDGGQPVAPVAGDDIIGVAIDTPRTIDVASDLLANDVDGNGDPLTLASFTQPTNGALVDNGDGTLTYTPNLGYSGSDAFTYTVDDGTGLSDTARVDIAVTATGNIPPVAENDSVRTLVDRSLTLTIATDLLGNDSDPDGGALSLASFTQPANGALVDNGDGTLTYTPNAGYVGADAFTYTVTDGADAAQATVDVTVDPTISVWYGGTQAFGALGEPQVWVNLLGEVADDVVGLSYSLNGGPERALSIGADTRRLQNDGDFNIDIAYDELDPTAVDDIVTIRATLASGEVITRDVVVDYLGGNRWATDYAIDWASVGEISDVAQVVDGLWGIEGGGLRILEPGYDRVVALGDQGWDNYEANLQVTINAFGADPNGRDGGGLAFGMLWDGHTDDPIAGWQPKSGWEPHSAIFFTDNDANGTGQVKVHQYKSFFDVIDTAAYSMREGATYNVTIRVEQTNVLDHTYSMKFWEVGTPEPTEWTVQATETFTEPVTGSFVLNAHYFDVTFGDVSITEIPGDDILKGTDGDDLLLAADTLDPMPGLGEIDVLQGQAGPDTFVLGGEGVAYYDDGDAATEGLLDYALLWDFTTGLDTIRLGGLAEDYALATSPTGLHDGTAIYRLNDGVGPDELIAIAHNVSGLSLTSPDFEYDPLVA